MGGLHLGQRRPEFGAGYRLDGLVKRIAQAACWLAAVRPWAEGAIYASPGDVGLESLADLPHIARVTRLARAVSDLQQFSDRGVKQRRYSMGGYRGTAVNGRR